MEDSKRYFWNASRKLEKKNAMDWVAEIADIDYSPRGHSWRQREIDSTDYRYEKGRSKINNEIPPKTPKDKHAGYIYKAEIQNAN